MFWGKKKAEDKEMKVGLSGPREIPAIVQNYLVTEKKMDPDLVKLLKALVYKSNSGEKAFNIRIYDEADAVANKVQIKDYTTLDQHPHLILYEGVYDEGSKYVKLEEKKEVNYNIPIYTEAEIREQIESLKNPGDMVFFYMARGASHGGPLGMGAAIIELNPNYPGKKEKKYIVYTADVIDMKPVGKGQKLFGSDKPKDIASWVINGHHKRVYSS
ncbi:MAG: hypothetical protein ACPL6D_01875 [Thermodesulfobacteriota bacterium]